MTDWFERLMGFQEGSYALTRARLAVEGQGQGQALCSLVNGRRFGIGTLELASLQSLRERVHAGGGWPGRLQVRNVSGDVRAMHREPAHAGALFQVASQFNLLEMVSPDVSPEDGVTRYQHDRTQGPACAMAAGAATVYRNYFAPVAGGAGEAASGQTRTRQLDALADVGAALRSAMEAASGRPAPALWTMRNGYALCTAAGLAAIDTHLAALTPAARDALRGQLRIGLHSDVEVTDGDGDADGDCDGDAAPGPRVSQAFCSALPVAYGRLPAPAWQGFAQFVLEAAYEATLCAAALNAQRGASNIVLLTRLGGGAFGNDDRWIDAAISAALHRAADWGLDVRLVSYGAPSKSMLALARDWAPTL